MPSAVYGRRPKDVPKSFLRDLRGVEGCPVRHAAMVADQVPDDSSQTRPRRPLAGDPGPAAGLGARVDLPPLAGAAAARSAADADTLYLTGPGGIRAWAERRYSSLIAEALADSGTPAAARSASPPRRAAPTRDSVAIDGVELNPNYTFDRFVIGPGNRLAHGAALAVAEAPSEAYNPLFLHGPPGLGKTHLLAAIANYLRANAPGLSVRYTTAESFTNEFVARPQVRRRRGLQGALPRHRRAADRRRPVPRGQARHRGGVLPHLQRPLRVGQPAGPLRRPHPQRALDPRLAPARPLRVGPDRRRSSRPTWPPG